MASEAAVAQDGQFLLVFLVPDVCITPGKGGQPVPYPITQIMEGSERCSENVFFAGKAAYLHDASYVDGVTGDEAGKGGGVVSQVNAKTSHSIGHSSSVYINGRELVRTGDKVWMNQKKP